MENLLFLGALIIIITGIITGNRSRRAYFYLTAFILFSCLFLEITISHRSVHSLFYNYLADDGFAHLFKIVFLVLGLILILIRNVSGVSQSFRFYFLLMINTLSGMMLVSGVDLIPVIILLELFNLSMLVLITEANENIIDLANIRKFYLFHVFANAIIVIGIIGLILHTGATRLDLISASLKSGMLNKSVELTMFIILCGFGFQLSIVPFHFLNFDIAERMDRGIGSYFIILSQISASAVIIRILTALIMPLSYPDMKIRFLLVGVGIISALLIPLHLFKYSSKEKWTIPVAASQSGIIFIALGSMSIISVRAVYSLIITVFPFLLLLDFISEPENRYGIEMSGINSNRYYQVFVLAAVIGLPPMGSYFAKVQILSVLHSNNMYFSEGVVVLQTALLLFLICNFMFGRQSNVSDGENPDIKSFRRNFAGILIFFLPLILVLILGVFWNSFFGWITGSLNFIFFNFPL